MDNNQSLEHIRQKISQLDEEILKLLHERFFLLPSVVDYKSRRQLPIQDAKREQEILQELKKTAKRYRLEPDFVKKLFEDILKESRQIQNQLLEKKEWKQKELKKFPAGSLVPFYETVKLERSIDEYFAVLSDYGRKPNSFLLESADIVPRYGEFSVGSADPCLKITGTKHDFMIQALNKRGERLLPFLASKLDFVADLKKQKQSLQGTLVPERRDVSEEQRLNLKTHIDILRALTFAFTPVEKPFTTYGGLFGMLSYDFIDQFEDLPPSQNKLYTHPDYIFYFTDTLFLADHKAQKLHFIANALITDSDEVNKRYEEALDVIEGYKKALSQKIPKLSAQKTKKRASFQKTDTERKEFIDLVHTCKEHIKQGDVFQIVASRSVYQPYSDEPLDIYKRLKKKNPSPYMAFMNFGEEGILLGASPEMCLRVQGDAEKTVEIRPIAGTRPRGFKINGEIDSDLDNRYEIELKIDIKELAEHVMLIDLARNDIARVCKAGTRKVSDSLVVEKYSHVQHLVSQVEGILKKNYDAFHAYLACMNMGTLTGAPKVKAMELLRKYEKNKRGFYGGTVGYFTPSGEMDSMIVIRTMFLKDGIAYIRAGAGIVYDSIPEKEFEETEKKMAACLSVLK